jgi:hypothetical protein
MSTVAGYWPSRGGLFVSASRRQRLTVWEDQVMKRVALAVLTAATLLGTAGAASAQYWGGGYYQDDPGPYYRHRYRDRYYDEDDRHYRREDYRERRGYRTGNGCPPHYTVQDGVCKPYRGY